MPVASVIQAYSSFLIIGCLVGFMKRGAVQPLVAAVVIAIVGFYAAGIEGKHPKRDTVRYTSKCSFFIQIYIFTNFNK